MKLCDALVYQLAELGVGHIFGVSGANIEHLHDSINRLEEPSLVSVLCKTEMGAAFMADAHARVHKKLGVCCATSGGGMMNLAVGIAESHNDSVPVLAIVGQPPTKLSGKGAFQDSSGEKRSVNALNLFQSITKYSVFVDEADKWWDLLANALGHSLGGRPGPTALLIPRDMFEVEVGKPPSDWFHKLSSFLPKPPKKDDVRMLLDRIYSAKNPVLVLGQGIKRCNSSKYIKTFIEEHKIPVVVTPSAISEFDTTENHFLGVCGITGNPSAHKYIEENCDLIVLVGTSLDVMSRGPITNLVADGLQTVVVNIEPETVHVSGPNIEYVIGDAGEIFHQLLEVPSEPKSFEALTLDYKVNWIKPVVSNDLGGHPDGGMRLSEAISILNRSLPDKTHALLDAGNCAATMLHLGKISRFSSSTIALGMGGMGYSIAGAIGAQIGSQKDESTVVFVGDAAFLMTGFEIHTAAELNLPILFIVFNNNMHGMCAVRQKLYFEGRFESVHFKESIDYMGIAKSLTKNNFWCSRVETPNDLLKNIEEFYKGPKRTGLIEVLIGEEEVPPFLPFLNETAELTEVCPA